MKTEITPLPNTFTRGDYTCKVVARDGQFALLQLSVENRWEVTPIVIRTGDDVGLYEDIPHSPTGWGVYGWSFTNKKLAKAKFRSVVSFKKRKK